MISFHYEEIPFRLDLEDEIGRWLSLVASQHGREISQLSYVFVNDEQLAYLHEKYLKDNSLTDILTFDYSPTAQSPIVADIFISEDRVRENATELRTPFVDEIHRVMVHGLLHVCGFTDHTDSDKKRMRREEDLSLNLRLF